MGERGGYRRRRRDDYAFESGGAAKGVPDSIEERLGFLLLLLLHCQHPVEVILRLLDPVVVALLLLLHRGIELGIRGFRGSPP